jgi:integrase
MHCRYSLTIISEEMEVCFFTNKSVVIICIKVREMCSASNSDIQTLVNAAVNELPPNKSRKRYNKELSLFENWKCEKGIKNVDKDVVLANFYYKVYQVCRYILRYVLQTDKLKPSTLQSIYSMLKAELNIKDNIDIIQYSRLRAFLKRKTVGYTPKKSKFLTADDIAKYLKEADDNQHLMIKVKVFILLFHISHMISLQVAVIFGVYGACRREELYNLTILLITIPNTRTYKKRVFTIVAESVPVNALEMYRKYLGLRPTSVKHTSFFQFITVMGDARCKE